MPLKRKELVRRLAEFGVTEDKKKGKGGDRKYSGTSRVNGRKAVACMGFHGGNSDIPDSKVKALRRRFGLVEEHGVSDADWDNA